MSEGVLPIIRMILYLILIIVIFMQRIHYRSKIKWIKYEYEKNRIKTGKTKNYSKMIDEICADMEIWETHHEQIDSLHINKVMNKLPHLIDIHNPIELNRLLNTLAHKKESGLFLFEKSLLIMGAILTVLGFTEAFSAFYNSLKELADASIFAYNFGLFFFLLIGSITVIVNYVIYKKLKKTLYPSEKYKTIETAIEELLNKVDNPQ